jgi:hypothetical protein
MNVLRPLVLTSILLAAGPSGAVKPGDAQVEEPDKESNDQRIEVFDNNKAESMCKVKGRICLKAGPGTDVEGSDAAPTFKRRDGAKQADWVLDLYGNFKKAALAGNAQFIFSDVQDSKEAKKRILTAMYQATVKANGSVSARVRLSNDEGLRVGRVYHVLIVQLLGGKEVILAEGDFQLK